MGLKKVDQEKIKTTGHEWDGITEYDLPDPMWLRILFYICLFFALIYWILYPSWPTPNNEGIFQWSAVGELTNDLYKIDGVRKKYQEQFDKFSFEEILKNEDMMKFAMAGGRSAFANNCALCHGAGGGGNPGYPNLTSGSWLWGGKIDDIYTTIKYGIRSEHLESRDSEMPAFGQKGTLSTDEIAVLTKYVLAINKYKNSKYSQDKKLLSSGEKLFIKHCSSCHGNQGQGNRDVGAPNLTDAVSLYGDSYDTIYDVIYHGRSGVMPNWQGKLSDSTIRQLALYVHQLGGGE